MNARLHRWWLWGCFGATLVASLVGGFGVSVTAVFIGIYLTGLVLIGPDESADAAAVDAVSDDEADAEPYPDEPDVPDETDVPDESAAERVAPSGPDPSEPEAAEPAEPEVGEPGSDQPAEPDENEPESAESVSADVESPEPESPEADSPEPETVTTSGNTDTPVRR